MDFEKKLGVKYVVAENAGARDSWSIIRAKDATVAFTGTKDECDIWLTRRAFEEELGAPDDE
jgi:hypothetical protein